MNLFIGVVVVIASGNTASNTKLKVNFSLLFIRSLCCCCCSLLLYWPLVCSLAASCSQRTFVRSLVHKVNNSSSGSISNNNINDDDVDDDKNENTLALSEKRRKK